MDIYIYIRFKLQRVSHIIILKNIYKIDLFLFKKKKKKIYIYKIDFFYIFFTKFNTEKQIFICSFCSNILQALRTVKNVLLSYALLKIKIYI